MTIRNIVLVGPMGAGKSTIGKQLAASLDFNFVDVDQHIVNQAGADIPWIFHKEGEDGFRKRETLSLQQSLLHDHTVIATGGGIITRKENVKLLNQAKFVVYLQAEVETQFKRTGKDKNRPLLQEADPRQKLAELMKHRSPLYDLVADLSVSTDDFSVKEVVNTIASHWQGLA
ncbi:MAG: shikimate kinase [Cellvibrionales bacterium]|nr:shikimate kinase [Cellvibrionales bacterium]